MTAILSRPQWVNNIFFLAHVSIWISIYIIIDIVYIVFIAQATAEHLKE